MLNLVVSVALLASLSVAPGDADPSWGTAGETLVRIDLAVRDVAVTEDGRVVVAGGSQAGASLVRLRPDGRVDGSFGTDGSVTVLYGSVPGYSAFEQVVPAGDALMAAVGSGRYPGNGVDMVVARFTRDGSVDPGFGGGDGFVTLDTGSLLDLGRRVAVDDVGRILVGGVRRGPGRSAIVVARLLSSGDRDPTFGTGGIALLPFTAWDRGDVGGLLAQPNGRIVVAGAIGNGARVARLLPDGSLDHTFGSDGLVGLPGACGNSDASAFTGLAERGGGYVAVGWMRCSHPGALIAVLASWTKDGQPDPAFAAGSSVDFASSSYTEPPYEVAVDPAGRFLLQRGEVLWRYLPDGSPDETFGDGGQLAVPGTGFGFHSGMAMQPDGRILLASSGYDGSPFLWVTRLLPG
jgi:uncharacterized delta-60 repeat protein